MVSAMHQTSESESVKAVGDNVEEIAFIPVFICRFGFSFVRTFKRFHLTKAVSLRSPGRGTPLSVTPHGVDLVFHSRRAGGSQGCKPRRDPLDEHKDTLRVYTTDI